MNPGGAADKPGPDQGHRPGRGEPLPRGREAPQRGGRPPRGPARPRPAPAPPPGRRPGPPPARHPEAGAAGRAPSYAQGRVPQMPEDPFHDLAREALRQPPGPPGRFARTDEPEQISLERARGQGVVFLGAQTMRAGMIDPAELNPELVVVPRTMHPRDLGIRARRVLPRRGPAPVARREPAAIRALRHGLIPMATERYAPPPLEEAPPAEEDLAGASELRTARGTLDALAARVGEDSREPVTLRDFGFSLLRAAAEEPSSGDHVPTPRPIIENLYLRAVRALVFELENQILNLYPGQRRELEEFDPELAGLIETSASGRGDLRAEIVRACTGDFDAQAVQGQIEDALRGLAEYLGAELDESFLESLCTQGRREDGTLNFTAGETGLYPNLSYEDPMARNEALMQSIILRLRRLLRPEAEASGARAEGLYREDQDAVESIKVANPSDAHGLAARGAIVLYDLAGTYQTHRSGLANKVAADPAPLIALRTSVDSLMLKLLEHKLSKETLVNGIERETINSDGVIEETDIVLDHIAVHALGNWLLREEGFSLDHREIARERREMRAIDGFQREWIVDDLVGKARVIESAILRAMQTRFPSNGSALVAEFLEFRSSVDRATAEGRAEYEAQRIDKLVDLWDRGSR